MRRLLLAAAVLLAGCVRADGSAPVTLRFWAMGREGEVVQELIDDFERENPGVRVIVQQIPWAAAHEKLLTAYVGRSTPDLAQLGNTWVSEFVALRAIEPLDRRLAASPEISPDAFFAGIWDTNVIDGVPYGVPWYVDTRVLFYRSDLLAEAGYDSVPGDWDGWRDAMQKMKREGGADHYPIFLPTNEYTPWIVFGLQTRLAAPRRSRYARSVQRARPTDAPSRSTWTSSSEGLAPAVQGASIANLYQEFERGSIAMYITGPWNLGEFRRRLSPAHAVEVGDRAPSRSRRRGNRHLDGGRIEPGSLPRLAPPGRGVEAHHVSLHPRIADPFLPAHRRSAGAPRGVARHRSHQRLQPAHLRSAADARGLHAEDPGVGADLDEAAEHRGGDGSAAARRPIRRSPCWTGTWTASWRSVAGCSCAHGPRPHLRAGAR